MAVIEFARHVLGWADASSSEFSSTAHPVIDLMPDQVNVTAKGGTMRLGRYPCVLAEGSRSRELYGAAEISERHRHRFEFNNDFRAEMQVGGMRLAACPRTAAWWRSSSCRTTPGSWVPSFHRSLESVDRPILCSGGSWPRHWNIQRSKKDGRLRSVRLFFVDPQLQNIGAAWWLTQSSSHAAGGTFACPDRRR